MKKRICISVDSELNDKVRKEAEKDERPIVWYYEKAMREYFEKHNI